MVAVGMEGASPKREWVLTAESFGKLLARLDSDVEVAGEKYETLRRMLVKFFDWRGAPFPEEHADEAFNRVSRKLDEGLEIRDLASYCYGVARLLYLEISKSSDSKRAALSELDAAVVPVPDSTADDHRRICFEACVESLSAESRLLITEYYQHDRREKIAGRRALAERLGIPLNALRSRATRIRDKLESCVKNCIEKGERLT
jgi:DNA-directed RNA polymerase specialized sigma24 family protein